MNFRALYGRIWRQASKAERICHAGGTGDVSDRLPATRGQWGSWRQYNGAAGFHNGGKFTEALELAEKARAHPSFSDLAADLIKMIKDRSGLSLPRMPH